MSRPAPIIDSAWRISVGQDEDGTWTSALSIAQDPNDVTSQVLQLVWNRAGFESRVAAVAEARETAAEADARFEEAVR